MTGRRSKRKSVFNPLQLGTGARLKEEEKCLGVVTALGNTG